MVLLGYHAILVQAQNGRVEVVACGVCCKSDSDGGFGAGLMAANLMVGDCRGVKQGRGGSLDAG